MSRNYYSEINLHFVWHTKNSQPLLTAAVEQFTHRYLRQKLINTPGAYIHEIGGTDNHVHLAVSIAPTILISDLVGKLKGSSSHEANQQIGKGAKLLEWQAGYGVVTFSTKDLEWVVRYIQNQREHHAQGTILARLERIAAEEEAQAPQREAP
jgi:putative transposase